MRKLITKYKQFIIGLGVGAAAIVGIALFCSTGSEPYQYMSYVVRDVNGDTLVKTPKFSILYRGVSGVNVAGSMTVAGKNSGISSLWIGGAGSSSTASDKGIDTLFTYNGQQGVATCFVAGELFLIRDNASYLEVADSVVPIDSGVPFVVVEKSKHSRIASSGESKTFLTSVTPGDLDYNSAAAPKQ